MMKQTLILRCVAVDQFLKYNIIQTKKKRKIRDAGKEIPDTSKFIGNKQKNVEAKITEPSKNFATKKEMEVALDVGGKKF